MPEISAFIPEKTGRTFMYNNHNDLVKVLIKLIKDENKLLYFSKNCLDITKNKFNTKNMSKRFIYFVEFF